jgi:hypothetical protein
MISIPVTFSPFQAQGSLRIDQGWGSCYDCPVQPAGANMTTGANMTGAAGNATGGTHDSSLHTTNPAAYSTHDSRPSMRNVK